MTGGREILKAFFSFHGRVGRKKYFLLSLACLALSIAGFGVAALAEGIIGFVGKNLVDSLPDGFNTEPVAHVLFFVLVCVVLLSAGLAIFSLCIRRLQDLNWSGWLSFIALVPGANVIFLIILAFVSGTRGPNKYGPDPLNVPSGPSAPSPIIR